MSDKYLLVDLSNFVFRFVMSKKQTEQLAEDIHNNIDSFASSLLCNKVILFQDYKGSDYRKALYQEYKGNRKDKKPSKFQDAMDNFFKKLPTIAKILNVYYPLIKYKGVEADDMIYWLTTYLDNSIILSTDADLLQCGVHQFSYTKKRYITLEEQGFDSIKAFTEAKAIAGDNSDNIKGLERVGLKTVAKYFKKYGVDNFTDLRATIPKNTKSKIEQRILDGGDIYSRNIRLVDLSLVSEEIVSKKMKEDTLEVLEEYYG